MKISENLQAVLNRWHPKRLTRLHGITLQYLLSGAPEDDLGALYVVFSEDGHIVYPGTVAAPSCTFSMSHADFLKMLTGDFNSAAAFGNGTLRISGSPTVARELMIAHKAAMARGTFQPVEG